jgi:hypothetical protein
MNTATARRLHSAEFRAFVRQLAHSVSPEYRRPLIRALEEAGPEDGAKACAACRRVLPAEELEKLAGAVGRIVAKYERASR